MPATIEFVSDYVRQQARQLDLTSPASYAMHAHLIPFYYLECVARAKIMMEGQPWRERAERMRTPLFEPGGVLQALPQGEQNCLKAEAAKLADVFQRSSSNVEGRNGYLSLRNHALRGLDSPRKRACLTAVHKFLLTRPDGTTAAECFFGKNPRSMFAAILASVEILPAPLSPPRRAIGSSHGQRVADAVIEAAASMAIRLVTQYYHVSNAELLTSWGLLVAQYGWLCWLFDAATLVLEAGYP